MQEPHKYYGNWRPNQGSKRLPNRKGADRLEFWPSVGTNLARPVPAFGGALTAANARRKWETWHHGIPDAPEAPTPEREAEQLRRLEYMGTGDWPEEATV